jgi:acetoin utilization protein AcuB
MQSRELVSGWMTDRPITISPEATIAAAHAAMAKRGIRHLLVTDGGRLAGILSDRDVARALASEGLDDAGAAYDLLARPVAEIMTREELLTVDPLTDLAEAARILVYSKVSALPVLDGERVVGLLTTHDLMRALSAIPRPGAPYAPAACWRARCRGGRAMA